MEANYTFRFGYPRLSPLEAQLLYPLMPLLRGLKATQPKPQTPVGTGAANVHFALAAMDEAWDAV